MAEKPNDIEAIYNAALKKGSEAERSAYLNAVCGDDAVLRARLEALLKAHEEAGDFLEAPVIDPSVTLGDPHLTEGPGTIISRYKLLEKIGEGGMACVYMAEQKEPIRRKVALKIIKLGMDTKQVIARFEAERQALAMMDHPNIAKVLDAGATETGRPYFVMELVKGISITEYCDKNKLNTRERLDLFIQVCNAVQHAHQKGIIHRDIKPSNIMVTLLDGRPVPKVIDFGIAKATSLELTEKTLFTRYAQMIGTPEYMSPEQAEMSGLDVDTRTDIYSLGVLLYQLLTGALPFDPETLRAAGYAEIRRTIVEDEPPRPSTRLSSLGEEAKKVAESRGTEVSLLVARLRKELEWIPLKAIRKDRTRRYRSAAEMSDDVQNYLNGAPLIAGPESSLYRLKKSMHRNRALVISIFSVLAVLLAGIVASTVLAISADNSRAEAERQARISQAVADFLTDDLLGSVAPEKAKSPEVTVHSILDAASKSLEDRFEGKPLIEALIREKLGETYRKLGDYKAAEPHLERAYRIRAEQLGEEDISTLTSVHNLGSLYLVQARHDDAEPLLVGAWQIRRRLLGEEHPDTLASAVQVAYLSLFYGSSVVSDVEGLFAETLETARGVLGDEHVDTLDAMLGLSAIYHASGRHEEAESLCARGLETAERVLSAEHELTLWFMNLSAMLHFTQGRYGQGAQLVTRAFEIGQRALGNEHPSTIHSMFMRGAMHRVQQQDDEAESLWEESVQLSRRVLGDEHFWTLLYMHNLAILYRDQGRYQDAERLLAEALEGRRKVLGEEHPETFVTMGSLGRLYRWQGKLNQAEQLLAECYQKSRETLGEEHPSTIGLIGDLAFLYFRQGRIDEAGALRAKAIEMMRRFYGDENPITLGAMHDLGELYLNFGRDVEAETLLSKALEGRRRVLGEEHPDTQASMGVVYFKRGQYDKAEPLLVKELENERRIPGREIPPLISMYNLALVHHRQGDYDKAEPLLVELLESSQRVLSEGHPHTAAAMNELIKLYEDWGKPQKAEQWRTKLPRKKGTEEQ